MRRLSALLYAVPLIFLLGFFFYPMAMILGVSLTWDGGNDLGIGALVRQGYFWQLIWFTIWQAAASTLLTLLLGLPVAYLFAKYDFRGKRILLACTTIPFVMPTVVAATAFTTLLGPAGLLNQWLMALLDLSTPPISIMQTIWIILLAHVFYNIAVVVRMVGGFWANLNPRLLEAAAVMGATPNRLWREITLPLLRPSVIAAGLLVFLFCFTSFGVVLILGGLQFSTLETEIYRQTVSLFNLPVAAFLSLVQMSITFVVMALYTHTQRRTVLPLDMRSAESITRRPQGRRERLFVAGALSTVLLLLLAPLIALAVRSVTLGGQGVTVRYYAELFINRRGSAFFVTPIIAVRNSLFFAVATMILSLVLGIIASYLLARPRSRFTAVLDPIFLLPMGASAVTLGFGYILAMGSLRTSLLLTPIAHTLIAMPFVVRTFLPALRSMDPALRESASVMGASSSRTWWEIDAPMLYRAVVVSAVFAFIISLGEFGASLLVTRPDFPTMPVVIYRALGQPGLVNYGQALAMSTILMVVAAAAIALIERFRVANLSEF